MISSQNTTAYIGLGANLGNTEATLHHAVDQIRSLPGIEQLQLSPLYRTAPIDSSGPDYLNAVARIQTSLTAHQLLSALQNIELAHGRLRPYRNAPRTLDLDVLLFGTEHIHDAILTVPHPRMHERAFVLRPLYDLAPDLSLEQGVLQMLLQQCSDQAIHRVP
ncbi:2-amino-4-hydroxy-6-hydroxymethyldihydropteridine diphosphokinase [Alcaligenaceae bacterium CGII-47]|nr:2-amino-4-hydroxy-6-hydroxymethyldihydropteridine diphosphokinase [Alcaligenaceae bacterium CGII-47]